MHASHEFGNVSCTGSHGVVTHRTLTVAHTGRWISIHASTSLCSGKHSVSSRLLFNMLVRASASCGGGSREVGGDTLSLHPNTPTLLHPKARWASNMQPVQRQLAKMRMTACFIRF
jgi:hypothetical protein